MIVENKFSNYYFLIDFIVFEMYCGIYYAIKPVDGGRSLHVVQRHTERARELGSEATKQLPTVWRAMGKHFQLF